MHRVRYHDNGAAIEFLNNPPSPMARVFVFLIGLLPLYAPYDLLLKGVWHFTPFMLFPIVISTGAIVISAVVVSAALFGLNQYVCFDASTSTFIYGYETGITKYREKKIAFSRIAEVRLREDTWESGPPSYTLAVKVEGERPIIISLPNKAEAQRAVERINEMLKTF